MNIIDTPAQCDAFDTYLRSTSVGRFIRGDAISHSENEWDAFQAGWNAALSFNDNEYTRLIAHLRSRHIDFCLHRPIICPETSSITFLLWNCSGQLVGYQRYKPDQTKQKGNDPRFGRYFTRKSSSTVAVWGIESLCYPGPVFVCEGIFDAARLTEIRQPAIAVLSSNPDQNTRNFINSIGRPTIAVCDADAAGKLLAKSTTTSITVQGGDLGSAPHDFVEYLVKHRMQLLQNAASTVYN